MRFCSNAILKAMLKDAIDIGSFLTSSVSGVSIIIDRGVIPMIGRFFVFCCTILAEAFSN
jgi:hypothetical protein